MKTKRKELLNMEGRQAKKEKKRKKTITEGQNLPRTMNTEIIPMVSIDVTCFLLILRR